MPPNWRHVNHIPTLLGILFMGPDPKIAIFGLGYVGSAAAGCIASQGHTVLGVDISAAKVEALASGRAPIYEPGLDELIAEAHADGRRSSLGASATAK